MPFQVEFKLTSIFGRVYLPSTHGQPTYPCHRYGFLCGTEFCTPTCTPEKPVAKPVQFPKERGRVWSKDGRNHRVHNTIDGSHKPGSRKLTHIDEVGFNSIEDTKDTSPRRVPSFIPPLDVSKHVHNALDGFHKPTR